METGVSDDLFNNIQVENNHLRDRYSEHVSIKSTPIHNIKDGILNHFE